MSLQSRTIRAAIWSFSEQVARRILGVALTLVLASLVSPNDFGLIAMMSVFLGLGQALMNSGFGQALIRCGEVNQESYSTAFYSNLALGIISYFILYLLAPSISHFYNEPYLTNLIRVASLSVIINSFQVIQVAQMSRQLNFRIQMKISVPSTFLSGIVAIYAALEGFGVWALIIQMLLGGLLQAILFWFVQGWRPTKEFSVRALSSMYNFGYKLFLSRVIDTVFRNIYVIVIAKLFSPSIAGLYFFSERIKEAVIIEIVNSIQSVTYPALSKLQDDDLKLKAAYRKLIVVTGFIMFPVSLFLAVLAEPLFRIFLPARWLPGVPYLQLMCIASLLYPMHVINLNLLKVKGRSDLFLKLEVIKKVILTLVLIVSLDYGILGILVGQILTSIISYLPNTYYSAKLVSYSFKDQFADFFPSLALSSVVALFGYFFLPALDWVNQFVAVFVISIAMLGGYILVAFLLKLKALEYVTQIVKGINQPK